jgi:hypothetical protein
MIGTAFAQGRSDTVFISVNAGLQQDTQRLSESVTLRYNVEDTPMTATMGSKGVPLVDFGGTIRILNNLGVNVALSSLSDMDNAAVSAQIPHPFYLNRLRPVSGDALNVTHKELVFHTDAAYVVPSSAINLILFGGASFFSIKQDFVTDVSIDESYPFDTATFASATLTRLTASATGFNAGADVTWKLGRQWGVGGIIRYSRASVPFKSGSLDFGSVDVGGLQAGGGLRLVF